MAAAQRWAAGDRQTIEVFAEWSAVIQAWNLICDQWRTGGMHGVVLGLDWSACKILLSAAKVKLTAELIGGLRLMENEVRRVWQERAISA